MLSIPQRDTPAINGIEDAEGSDKQDYQSGFIEIDMEELSSENGFDDTESLYGLKRKLARFKLKNRFYN